MKKLKKINVMENSRNKLLYKLKKPILTWPINNIWHNLEVIVCLKMTMEEIIEEIQLLLMKERNMT